MKRLIEFAKAMSKAEWIIAAVLIAVAVGSVVVISRSIESAIAERKITTLETEKQDLLKQVDEAIKRDLIKQGEIKAKDEQIKVLTSQIADSNTKVDNAHQETQTAKVSYDKVRRDPPKFNSADDVGRIRELQSGLRELYPDSP
jgi:chromosome segregation ATPase